MILVGAYLPVPHQSANPIVFSRVERAAESFQELPEELARVLIESFAKNLKCRSLRDPYQKDALNPASVSFLDSVMAQSGAQTLGLLLQPASSTHQLQQFDPSYPASVALFIFRPSGAPGPRHTF